MSFVYFLIFLSFSLSDSIQINASDWDEWVYINLSLALINGVGLVDPGDSPEESLGWDIACKRYHFRTNSGLSGNGNGGAYVDSLNIWNSELYNSLIQVPENSYFERDTIVNTFYSQENGENVYGLPGIANPSLETWGWINTNDNYNMNYTDNQFIVRNANGDRFFKLWAVDYYNQNNTSGYISIYFDEISECSIGHDNCGECGGDGTSCKGCMDATACNYDQMASINDLESCDGDTDQDGVCNQDDICPNNWDPYQNDQDGDGLADACDDDDDDGDGLVDCWSFWYDPYDGDLDGDNIADDFGINCDDAALGINDLALLNDYSLAQNYPNPFNPSTSIEYTISYPSDISVDVFDINGRKIITLDRGFRNIGSYIIYWDGMNEQSQKMPSGLYVYRLMANGIEIEKKKMLLLF